MTNRQPNRQPTHHFPDRNEDGMNTAEYAVGTVGACGFATILYELLTSDFGQNLLKSLFDNVVNILPF